MKETIHAIFYFPSVTRVKFLMLVAVTLLATLFEGFGIAMLYPIMDFIEKGKDFTVLASGSRMWHAIGRVFDLFSMPKSLIALMIIVFCLLLCRQLFNYLRNIFTRRITENILSDIRSIGFKHFAEADLMFYDSHGVGELVNVLAVDGVRASGGIFSFFNLLLALTIFILYFIFLFVLSTGMTLFAVTIMGLVGILLKSRITRSGRLGRDVSEFNEKISSAIVERLNGIRLVKLSATEERETRFINMFSDRIKESCYAIAKIRAKMEFMVDPIVILAGLIILFFSVEVFEMSLAKTGVFVFVLLRLMPYTKDIFNSRQAMAGFSGSLLRVIQSLEEGRKAQKIRGGVKQDLILTDQIRFENVSFRYNDDEDEVLKNINISIPAGKMTALVGCSGAGKSTLVDFLPRMRVPRKGRIFFDRTPIEHFDLKVLRRSIAFVSQEGFLFNDTIENNIKYCRPDATEEEVVKAAEMAYADHFIRAFQGGYQTTVGERGLKLSGGQRQRIILARALLQNAQIIIMDEPTSSLDPESEKYIQRAMEEIREEKQITMIIIAHRLSTIKSSDSIIVIDKGRIIETGSHKELMHEDSWYADMVKMQALG